MSFAVAAAKSRDPSSPTSAGAPAVDSATARELLKEATKLTSAADLEDIGRGLEDKARVFGELLGDRGRLGALDEAGLLRVVGLVFSVRSRRKLVVAGGSIEELREAIDDLLHGERRLSARFDTFVERFDHLGPRRAHAFASELLHFTYPDQHWLWTHWIWDPATGKGALRLLTDASLDLGGDRSGETYLKVGRATALLARDGADAGYTHLGRGLFGTDVFLACTAAIAMYTQYRLRISQEFLRFVPELPELARRLLGVQALAGRAGEKAVGNG